MENYICPNHDCKAKLHFKHLQGMRLYEEHEGKKVFGAYCPKCEEYMTVDEIGKKLILGKDGEFRLIQKQPKKEKILVMNREEIKQLLREELSLTIEKGVLWEYYGTIILKLKLGNEILSSYELDTEIEWRHDHGHDGDSYVDRVALHANDIRG